MALWDRFSRMVRSNVGRLLDDPLEKSGAGKRLEQRMKELRARDGELKALDEQLITLKGHATFLERKLEKLKLKEAELEAKLRAASAHGSISAIGLEGEIQVARTEAAQVEAELAGTRSGVERAEAQKRALVEEKAARLAAAQEALLEAEGHVPPAPSLGAPPATPRPAPVAAAPAPPPAPSTDPAAPLGAEPPRIKVTIRAGDESPRKTIGPEPGATPARPAEPPGSSASLPAQKTLGPADDAPPKITVTPRDPDQLLDELERLGKLLEAGAISPEEFAAAKKKLL